MLLDIFLNIWATPENIISLILRIALTAGLCLIFAAWGEKWWKSLIPFYGTYLLYRHTWVRGRWLFILQILLDMAGANLTVELPSELLAQNAEYQMNQLRQRLRKSQMTMELYCKSAGLTPEQVREGYRREAERQLRAVLAVRAIAEAEQITVTQQEVDAEYARLSKLHDTPEEEIRKVLSRDAVAAAVTNQKVQRFLLDHAALTSVVEKE